jgi:hypothetical protein
VSGTASPSVSSQENVPTPSRHKFEETMRDFLKQLWFEWRWWRAAGLVQKAFRLMEPEMTDEETKAFVNLSALMLKRQKLEERLGHGKTVR